MYEVTLSAHMTHVEQSSYPQAEMHPNSVITIPMEDITDRIPASSPGRFVPGVGRLSLHDTAPRPMGSGPDMQSAWLTEPRAVRKPERAPGPPAWHRVAVSDGNNPRNPVTDVWRPETGSSFGVSYSVNSAERTEVVIGDATYRIPSYLLARMEAFYSNQKDWPRVRHDCRVFALATKVSRDITHTSFHGPTDERISVYYKPHEPVEAAAVTGGLEVEPAGTVVALSYGDPWRKPETVMHFMVKATDEPGQEPLYMGKFGVTGIIGLTTFAEALRAYPTAEYAAVVSGMAIHPPHKY